MNKLELDLKLKYLLKLFDIGSQYSGIKNSCKTCGKKDETVSHKLNPYSYTKYEKISIESMCEVCYELYLDDCEGLENE